MITGLCINGCPPVRDKNYSSRTNDFFPGQAKMKCDLSYVTSGPKRYCIALDKSIH